MIGNILYAKKLILPSTKANVLQSLQMAAAFSATGLPTFFFPGVNPHSGPGSGPRANSGSGPGVHSGSGPGSGQHSGPGVKSGSGPGARAAALSEILAWQLAAAGIDLLPCQWKALRAGHKGLYGLRFRLETALLVRRKAKTLIYARDVGEAAFMAALRRLPLFWRRDSRLVFEMHEVLYRQHRDLEGRAKWRATLSRERAILAAADGLVVTNMDLAERARQDLGFSGPVLEAPNGVNEKVFRPVELFTDQNPWPGKKDRVRLVYIGAARPGKGVPELLRAMALLPERFCLTIIGQADKAASLELPALVRAVPQGEERIHLTGHVPQTEIFVRCRGAHMALIPQQEWGGFFSPLKFNEALALGLPVVCTPLALFARHKDLCHQSRDCTPEALSAAIAELAALPDRARRLRDAGLAAAAGRTWKARAASILNFAGDLSPRRV